MNDTAWARALRSPAGLRNEFLTRSPLRGTGAALLAAIRSVGDTPATVLKISIACQLDSVGRYLALEESTVSLLAVLDGTSVLCIQFRWESNVRPAAHVYLHSHRGAQSYWLSQAGHGYPYDMSSLTAHAVPL